MCHICFHKCFVLFLFIPFILILIFIRINDGETLLNCLINENQSMLISLLVLFVGYAALFLHNL